MSRGRAVVILCTLLGVLWAITTYADTASDLQTQIDASTEQIAQLKAEIAQLQTELNSTSEQKQTLQMAVRALDLNIQKLTKNISLTNAQITQKDKEITSLSGSITTTIGNIVTSKMEIAGLLREHELLDAQPIAVALLGGTTLSELFDQAATLGSVRTGLQNHIYELSSLKITYETDKNVAEKKRMELANLKANLNQEKQGLAIARDAQNQLLAETKNKESTYQAQIAKKQAEEIKFEQDLLNFESQLNLLVNPGSFAAAQAGVLMWPLDSVYITQYFGNTDFATKNPQLYNGKGHNAIDLRASPGTPVRAARGGVVRGVGNTDLTCPGASYGKWVFIDHDNGLSTIYAHLATYTVGQGDTVSQGQVLGYSDTTGYATGPHLHFGVYASAGAKITSFPSKSCKGKVYTMPVADLSAYLNPLSYLPILP
ncbi:peptidoglycan DD-metalloendopeptidase family protein [Patescibacteria group bacterium]|nr:peptidoglycan DD-metalloendopeptidase family protein [Patescibacteria group bacterium]